jgi:hypothetical protein
LDERSTLKVVGSKVEGWKVECLKGCGFYAVFRLFVIDKTKEGKRLSIINSNKFKEAQSTRYSGGIHERQIA